MTQKNYTIDNNRGLGSRAGLTWISGGTDGVASIFRLLLLSSSILLVSLTLTTTTTHAQDENKTSVSSFGLDFSPRPIVDEVVINTGETPINETHTIVTFVGNGTMTVPDTGMTFNQTNHGYAIISPLTGSPGALSSYGKETVLSDDGDTTSFTFYEIIQSDTTNPLGKGIMIAVYDRNATGQLAPFNGMMAVGTHKEPLNPEAFLTLWEWRQPGFDD
jgi:hypothetical protein